MKKELDVKDEQDVSCNKVELEVKEQQEVICYYR
jgi:hypothetical protein